MFRSLGHTARVRLVQRLARESDAGLTAGELAEETGLPASTLSFHLSELRAAKLLRATRDGRNVRYAIAPDALRALIWFLGEDFCQGRSRLLTEPLSRVEELRAPATADAAEDDDIRNIAFVCTHNAARSLMAEALLRHRAADRFHVMSAGMRPRPVHELTLRVLEEADISTEGLTSKDLGQLLGKQAIHRAIVLCPEAQADCPNVAPFAQSVEYWPFPDPTEPARSRSAQLAQFRKVRDSINARLGTWLLQRGRSA